MTVLAPGAKAPVAVPIEPCAVIDGIEIVTGKDSAA